MSVYIIIIIANLRIPKKKRSSIAIVANINMSRNRRSSLMYAKANLEKELLDEWFYDCNYLVLNDFIDALKSIYNNQKSKKEINILSNKYFRYFDYSHKKRITNSHVNRRLHNFLRDILNARSTYDSFKDILNNFDSTISMVVIIILIFVYLLIFKFTFSDAISLYISILAIVLIFGKNSLLSLMDGITFTFFFLCNHLQLVIGFK